MVEAPLLVVGLSRTAEGIVGLIKRHGHLGACGEAASDTDRSDRVQAIGILQDLALDRLGHEPAGERVDTNAFADWIDQVGRAMILPQDFDRLPGTDLTGKV